MRLNQIRTFSKLILQSPQRVRFAPSPTGQLHLGGLRTALFNFLLARKTNGKFILRIEDTDQNRIVDGAIDGLIDTLRWSGIEYNEGPDRVGTVGPYIQSERLEIYRKYADHLLAKGSAYRCYCSKERLAQLKDSKGHGRYDGTCRNLPISSHHHHPNSGYSVIRLRVPEGETRAEDLVFGKSLIPHRLLDDIVIMKSDGFPTYHFANVVDDHEMGITTVMRGQEWLPSTALHLLLYKIFDWSPPLFAHLPLLINVDGSKLSKRQHDAFVGFYRDKGYFPSALVNFLAFLGWNSGDCEEIMTLDELIQKFEINKINRADALVDMEKLNWFNRRHFSLQHPNDLLLRLKRAIGKDKIIPSDDKLIDIIDLFKGRVNFIEEIPEMAGYMFSDPTYRKSDREFLLQNRNIIQGILSMPEYTSPETVLQNTSHISNVKHGDVLKIVRLALTGAKIGPSLVETMKVLGPSTVRTRLSQFSI